MSEIAERFKELRKTLGLTQKSFGERILVSPSYVSKLEAGKEEASNVLIKLIAYEFNISYDWITEGTKPMFLNANDYDSLDRGHSAYYKDIAYRDMINLLFSINNLPDGTFMYVSTIIMLIKDIFDIETETQAQKELLITIVSSFVIALEEKLVKCVKTNKHDSDEVLRTIRFVKNMDGERELYDELISLFLEYN